MDYKDIVKKTRHMHTDKKYLLEILGIMGFEYDFFIDEHVYMKDTYGLILCVVPQHKDNNYNWLVRIDHNTTFNKWADTYYQCSVPNLSERIVDDIVDDIVLFRKNLEEYLETLDSDIELTDDLLYQGFKARQI